MPYAKIRLVHPLISRRECWDAVLITLMFSDFIQCNYKLAQQFLVTDHQQVHSLWPNGLDVMIIIIFFPNRNNSSWLLIGLYLFTALQTTAKTSLWCDDVRSTHAGQRGPGQRGPGPGAAGQRGPGPPHQMVHPGVKGDSHS